MPEIEIIKGVVETADLPVSKESISAVVKAAELQAAGEREAAIKDRWCWWRSGEGRPLKKEER